MYIQDNSDQVDPVATIKVAFNDMPIELKVFLNLLSVLFFSLIIVLYFFIGNEIFNKINNFNRPIALSVEPSRFLNQRHSSISVPYQRA